VEVGNEDFFASDTYTYRWHDFVTALQPLFPNIEFIATSHPNSPVLSPKPAAWDNHVYKTPSWFQNNTFTYDSVKRDGTKYFEGEYAAFEPDVTATFEAVAAGRLPFPTMQGAAGEAAFMTGLERNSDIVFAASYAPLLGHVTNHQWTPNLLAFDAGSVYLSTSFYVQKLFSQNRGDLYIPSTLPSPSGTLFWSVARKTSGNQIIIKISNTAATAAPLTFVLPFNTVSTTGSTQVLTGAGPASNTPANPNLLVPVAGTIKTAKTFNYTAPAISVSVLTFTAV
jgi:alpha-N-arabinofuranosidase